MTGQTSTAREPSRACRRAEPRPRFLPARGARFRAGTVSPAAASRATIASAAAVQWRPVRRHRLRGQRPRRQTLLGARGTASDGGTTAPRRDLPRRFTPPDVSAVRGGVTSAAPDVCSGFNWRRDPELLKRSRPADRRAAAATLAYFPGVAARAANGAASRTPPCDSHDRLARDTPARRARIRVSAHIGRTVRGGGVTDASPTVRLARPSPLPRAVSHCVA